LTTKRKTPKVTKLRNAEYYNFQNIQDKLYEDSKNNKSFTKLMDIITMEENILLAYRNIKKNKGSKTAGIDNLNIDDISKWKTENLVKHIRKKFEWYKPKAVKRVEIPKANGKTRPLGIPTIIDRIIQQCILQVLEPICEAKFHERNNGFRPCRGTEHAIAQTYKYIQVSNLKYVVDIDIKGFFDNVQHAKLLKQIWTLGIRDKKLISIISTMLKAEIFGIGFPTQGTPQGGILSPLLSNIVLNELDWWITSQWENIPTKKEYCINKATGGKSSKFRAIRKTNLKECYIVRYADDFKIFCRNKNEAKRIFFATKNWLKERLGLDISEEKSKIVNIHNHYSEFLGIKITTHRKGKKENNDNKYTIKSYISSKSYKNIEQKVKEYIKEIKKCDNHIECHKLINNYNSYVMGVHNYYSMATHISRQMSKIAFIVNKELKKAKGISKLTADKSKKKCLPIKYYKSKQIRYKYDNVILPIGYVKHKRPMYKKSKINKYTKEGREEIHKELNNINPYILTYLMKNYIPNKSIEYNDNRLAIYVAQKGKCYITGETLEIGKMHCHHIKPVKNGGMDNYDNLTFVTENAHRLIHANNNEVISKYLEKLKLNNNQIEKLNKLREKAKLPTITVIHHPNS
jgi:group II intron reverse transcriptase/maturase